MTEQEKINLLEETFEIDDSYLKPDMLLEDVEEYDSLTKLALIVMFEDEFDKKVDVSIIRDFKKISDIMELME